MTMANEQSFGGGVGITCVLKLSKDIVTLTPLLNSKRSGYRNHVVLFLQMIGMANQMQKLQMMNIVHIFNNKKAWNK